MAVLSNSQLGFVLIALAGLASSLGALAASLVPAQTQQLVSVSLAFSSGVLIWVALVGLHPESLEAFDHAHESHSNHVNRDRWLPRFFTLMSIMLGLFVGWMIDVMVHQMDLSHSHGESWHRSDACCQQYTSLQGEQTTHLSDGSRRSSKVAPPASNVGTPPPIPAGVLEGIPMQSLDPADFDSGAEENPILVEPAASMETPPGETEHQLSIHSVALHNLQKMMHIRRKQSESHSVRALRGSLTAKKRHMSADDTKKYRSESDVFLTDSDEKDSDEKRGDGGWYNFSRFRAFTDSRRTSIATSNTGQASHLGRIKSSRISGRLSGISSSSEAASTAVSWAETHPSKAKTEATQTTALLRDNRRVDISDLRPSVVSSDLNEQQPQKIPLQGQFAQVSGSDSGQSEDRLTVADREVSTSHLSDVDESGNRELLKAAMVTALVISIHNFPEGLATYTSTVADSDLGVMVAFAVALHNLPLGVSVGQPIFLSCGSDSTARLWAVLVAAAAGLSSMLGGFVGWLAFNDGTGSRVQGVTFGMVSGLMLWTAWKELLPQCQRADPLDQWTSWLVFLGFLVMDASLITFDKAGGHDHGIGGESHDEHDH